MVWGVTATVGPFSFPAWKIPGQSLHGQLLGYLQGRVCARGVLCLVFLAFIPFFLYCDTLPLLPFVLFYLIASSFLLVLSFFSLSLPLLRFC